MAALAEALEKQAAATPLCLVLDGGDDDQSLARALAAAEPSGNLLALLPALDAIPGPFARAVSVGPLDAAAIAALARAAAGAQPPGDAVARIAQVSGGHAATVAVLTRALVTAMREERPAEPVTEAAVDLTRLLADGFRRLPTGTRRLLAALALFGGARWDKVAPLLDGESIDDAAALARRAGWLTGTADAPPRLPSAVHQRVVEGALGDRDLHAISTAAAAKLPADDVRRAAALAAIGDDATAAATYPRASSAAPPAGSSGRRRCSPTAWSSTSA